jgi:hypothetical protein
MTDRIPGNIVPDTLNLLEGWSHLELEYRENPSHVSLSFLWPWIDEVSESWLSELESRLRDGRYVVGPLLQRHDHRAVGRGSKKPGCLDLEDDVVFTSLVAAILPKLLQAGFNAPWVCGPFITAVNGRPWTQGHRFWFRLMESHSEALLEDGYEFVAQTDVLGFFPNMEHRVLISQLEQLGCLCEHLQLLARLLAIWYPEGRGVPWNVGSHVLGSAVLFSVDKRIEEIGHPHLRLADDFRVFCHNREEAKVALEVVAESLSELGLECNQGKTRVIPVGVMAYRSPIKGYLNKLGAKVLIEALRIPEGVGLGGVGRLPRKLLHKLLSQVHRPYLGRLVAGLPDLRATVLALLRGEIPASYLPVIAPNLGSLHCRAELVEELDEAVTLRDSSRSAALILCHLLGTRPSRIPSCATLIERLEVLNLCSDQPDLLDSVECGDSFLEMVLRSTIPSGRREENPTPLPRLRP